MKRTLLFAASAALLAASPAFAEATSEYTAPNLVTSVTAGVFEIAPNATMHEMLTFAEDVATVSGAIAGLAEADTADRVAEAPQVKSSFAFVITSDQFNAPEYNVLENYDTDVFAGYDNSARLSVASVNPELAFALYDRVLVVEPLSVRPDAAGLVEFAELEFTHVDKVTGATTTAASLSEQFSPMTYFVAGAEYRQSSLI